MYVDARLTIWDGRGGLHHYPLPATIRGPRSAVWSPDGRWAAFVGSRTDDHGDTDLYVWAAETGETHSIWSYPYVGMLTWSPDGGQLAFTSGIGDWWELHIMNVHETVAKQDTVIDFGTEFVMNPAWSPDGRRFAVQRLHDDDFDIFVVDADGRNFTNLTDHPANDAYPAWSPDGREIAFVSNRAGSMDVWRIGADGTGLKRVTTAPGDEAEPTWTAGKIGFTYGLPNTSEEFPE